ncbi:MAG: ATP-dependent RNA helicase HrpA [Gammaproteobacteria bacterium]|nr:ATP-dependent RNA helicase HrpA [Gammaproteobacteria bacterium]
MVTRAVERYERSVALVQRRRERVPKVKYPDELPITAHAEEIRQALAAERVVILAGETGSGKTTQLPKLCLEIGRGIEGTIGHTQPRRLAARSVASRIAEELGVELGAQVGYSVRFSDRTSDDTLIRLMTDGILLTEIRHDRLLERYDTLIIDEAHERSLNVDFLLGYLRRLLDRRDDLKVVITSATIDVERFSRHFDDAPVIEVSGRSFPVDVHYREIAPDDVDDGSAIERAIVDCMEEICSLAQSARAARDVLVFLPGEREIFDAARFLRRHLGEDVEILPLYARLGAREQQRVFRVGAPQAGKRRRVVLATNVAETSLTVPGIGYVIDPGLARVSRYSSRSKLQRLPIERISRASAEQRKGRCGRLGPGVCFRLFAEKEFDSRREYTDPEIKRTNLASVVLQMRALGFGEIAKFPFIEPPDPQAVSAANQLLEELGALEQGELTPLGENLARLPVDPSLGRILIEGARRNCLSETLIIVSALAAQDPRERPVEHRAKADALHQEFDDERSDFLAFVNLWNWFEAERGQLTRNQQRRVCRERMLSYQRMREWRDLHRQLHLACRGLRLAENRSRARYEEIHRTLLSGFLGNVGLKDDQVEYNGARGRKFRIFPGSTLFRRRPRWVLSAEIVETTQVYARCVARIEPRWIEEAARHLVKRTHSEPHWRLRHGEVMAYERVTLYGLALVERRLTPFEKIDPMLCRELLIRDGLLTGAITTQGEFLAHNLDLHREVAALEARARARDIVADDTVLFDFYDQRIPDDVASARSLERWRKRVEATQPRLLFMDLSLMRQRSAPEVTEERYPFLLEIDDIAYRLRYRFAPGQRDDGVSLEIHPGQLMLLKNAPLEWLVPGMLEEVVVALIRSLPRSLRRRLVPVPEIAGEVTPQLLAREQYRSGYLRRALGLLLERRGVSIALDAWNIDALPMHLRINIQLMGPGNKVIDQDRDLEALASRHRNRPQDSEVSWEHEAEGIADWPDLSEIPEHVVIESASGPVVAFPALHERGDSVALTLFEEPAKARIEHRHAVLKLVLLQARRIVRDVEREVKQRADLLLESTVLLGGATLVEQLLRRAVELACFPDEIPRTNVAFQAGVALGKHRIRREALDLLDVIEKLLSGTSRLRSLMQRMNSPAYVGAIADCRQHLERLFHETFLEDTPAEWLAEFPRFLDAMNYRLAHLQGKVERDAELSAELERWQLRFEELLGRGGSTCELDEIRWLLEEYRVSLFAQRLKTRVPVSQRRLAKLFEAADVELGMR